MSASLPDASQPDDEGSNLLSAARGDVSGGADPIEDDVVSDISDDATNGCEGKTSRFRWARLASRGLLAGLALLLAIGGALLTWKVSSAREAMAASSESAQVAKDTTVAVLSYDPDSADKELVAARDRLTGSFKDSYTALTNDVVIPEAKKKRITAVASVPAAASVSASPDSAVVLVLVDQTVVIGAEPPTNTASSVRVTLTKQGDRWLVSGFDPV